MSNINVIIVNYRTAPFVLKGLASIACERGLTSHSIRVYVVDNNSGDDSVDLIAAAVDREHWGDWIDIIPNPTNRGFAAGNNTAISQASRRTPLPDYFYFLNPDAVIKPGAIRILADFLDQRTQVAIVGSSLEEPDGTASCSSFRFPSFVSEFLKGASLGFLDNALQAWVVPQPMKEYPHRTDWVSGASFMVRREVFSQLGMMDEGYFLYFEEVDFMKSAAKADLQVWSNPYARVIHEAGASTKIKNSHSQDGPLPSYWYDSWRRYFVKHHGRLGALLAGTSWLLGKLLYTSKMLLQSGKDQSGGRTTSDFLVRGMAPILRKRAQREVRANTG